MSSKKLDSEQWSARLVKAHLPPPLETTSDLRTTSADLREIKRDLAILSQTVNKLRGAAASSEHKLDDIDKELAELRDQVRSQAQFDRLNNTASYYTDMTEGATSMASEVASTTTALERRLRRLESQSAEHKRQACLSELAIIENQQDCSAKMHDQDARLAKTEQLLQEILPSRSKDVQPQVVGKVTFVGDGSSDTSSAHGHQNAVANAPHAAKPPQKDEHLEEHFLVLEQMFAAREEACKSELDMLKSRVSALEASKPQARQTAMSYRRQDSLETPPSYKLSLGLFSSSGDRIEFNKTDEETQYTFQPSVWDVSLFIGTPLFGLGENIVIVLVFIINLVVAATFIVMCQSTLVRDVFDDKTLRDFRLWRSAVAHDVNYMNALTGESLASGVCNEKLYFPVSNYQIEVVQDLRDYLDSPPLIDLEIPRGLVMCYLSLGVWYFVLITELRDVAHVYTAWRNVPVEEITVFMVDRDDSTIHIASIAFWRKVFLKVILALRSVVVVFLGWQGTMWLGKEIAMGDMLLNSAALKMVLHIDELLFESLLPTTPASVLERIAPLRCKEKSRLDKWWDRQGVFWFLCCVFGSLFCLVHLTLFQPYAEELRDNLNALCGGVDDSSYEFVMAIDAIGIPWTAPTSTKSAEWVPDDYAFAAISQAQETGYALQYANLQPTQRSNSGFFMQVVDGEILKSLMIDLPEFRRPSDWRMLSQEAVIDVRGWSDEHTVLGSQDFGDQKGTVYNHYLRHLLGTSGDTTCAAVPLDLCLAQGGRLQDVVMRQLCPHRCGCTSPTTGTVANPYVQVGTKVWLGCAPWTLATKEYQDKLTELPCNDTTSRDTFLNWAQGLGNVYVTPERNKIKLFDRLMSEFDEGGCPMAVTINIGITDATRVCSSTSISTICPTSCGCSLFTQWNPRHSSSSALCPHECQRKNRLCITIEKASPLESGPRGPYVGYPCKFPFVYKGVTYKKCTAVDWDAPWCAVYIQQSVSLLWGVCPEVCDYDFDYAQLG